MIANAARLLAAILLAGAVVGSFVITRYLSLLEQGIQQNVNGVERVVDVQKEIRAHNAELTRMVAVTRSMGTGLDEVVQTSGTILSQVKVVAGANRSTLKLNGALEEDNGASAKELTRVIAALRLMNQSAAAIRDHLEGLSHTAAADVDSLEAIAANTSRMNTRTPGW